MGRVENKVAIVTGAAMGLGKQTAKTLVKEGAKVVLVDFNENVLKETAVELAQSGSVHYVVADVSNEADVKNYVEQTIEKFGRIDIFFNNAGILGDVNLIVDTSIEDFDNVVRINLRGSFLGIKAVLQVMKEQRSGSIINTSSIDGLHASPYRVPYGATKTALVGITKTAAVEMAPYNVRVNSIHPGYANTDMMKKSEAGVDAKHPEKVKEQFLNNIPMHRYGEPQEIADLVLFLGSDESQFITGAQVPIDGGITAQ